MLGREIVVSNQRSHEIRVAHCGFLLPWANGVGGQQYSGSTLPHAGSGEFGLAMVNPSG
jgi:hypothetical protein